MIRVGHAGSAAAFPHAARAALANEQLRRNVRHATDVIRGKRSLVVDETPDWEALREAGRQIKAHTLRHLGFYLTQFEDVCTRAGGQVHWARDADEANAQVIAIMRRHAATEVIKVKTMTSDETGLNEALQAEGITPHETDLADLIIQLGQDRPSHIVVPALHRNRHEIRALFLEKMGLAELGDTPQDLTQAARRFLREKFLRVPVGFSGANFLAADTGSVCVVESEGNARMCLTLPRVLITMVGIEKVIPALGDLEVFLQLLPRSATGERMNPYNTIWTGVTPGDGPQEFHVILLDNGRTRVLADEVSRSTLQCIRCGACLNQCPVYRQTGGHAYGSIYSGPIGAILTPQLQGLEHSQSLPYASSLCGACYEVCPVKINIPEILIHLRRRLVEGGQAPLAERVAMKAAAMTFHSTARVKAAVTLARIAQKPFVRVGHIENAPGPLRAWTANRSLPAVPAQSFREVDGAPAGRAVMTTARDEVLGRIRDAVGTTQRPDRESEYAAIVRGYLRAPRFTREERLRLFASRLEDYDCGVFTTGPGAVPDAIADVLTTRGKRRLVAPRGFPSDYLPADFTVSHDDQLQAPEIESFDGVLTSCAVAIAFTGSIVLTHTSAEGRRALTLLPDYHLCLVPAERIVDTLPEALALIRDAGPSLITTISGPSATADIEMTRIRGVHGPRTLDVVIITD